MNDWSVAEYRAMESWPQEVYDAWLAHLEEAKATKTVPISPLDWVVRPAGIRLPALDLTVPVAAYVAAVRRAKANPTRTFRHGLTTWWPTTGADILNQFHQQMHQRITAGAPIRKANPR